jgi:hypothetical protein
MRADLRRQLDAQTRNHLDAHSLADKEIKSQPSQKIKSLGTAGFNLATEILKRRVGYAAAMATAMVTVAPTAPMPTMRSSRRRLMQLNAA